MKAAYINYFGGPEVIRFGEMPRPVPGDGEILVRNTIIGVGKPDFLVRSGNDPYLAKALAGKTAADIGASTGGFTDCMLQNGAVKVYAIDVGYGQLAWKLRTDERVVNMERTNIRNVTVEMLEGPIDFASIDVAFISLTKVLPVAYELLKDEGEIAALIKPQFEAGKDKVGKKGVVRDPAVHLEVVENIVAFSRDLGFAVRGLTFSPVKGPEGNIEYLVWLCKDGAEGNEIEASLPGEIVREAHAVLDK